MGQTSDTLQLSWKNSKKLGEEVDGYIIKLTKKIDDKDTPSSFRDIFGGNKTKYIVLLPENTDYAKSLITIDSDTVKKPIKLELGDSILAVEYYKAGQDKLTVTLKDLPRERLYSNIAALTITQEELTSSQRESFTLYKKSSPRSNQTVAGVQNLGDTTAPIGDIVLRRDTMNAPVSTGVAHEGYINTQYTLKSIRTDNVIVSRMEIRKDGQMLTGLDNQSQTGRINR